MIGAVVVARGARLTSFAAMGLALAAAVLGDCAAVQAQGLNPNPLLPSGVGSASDVDMSRGGGGGGIGRGVGPGGRGLEQNPADTLLREMNGTNNGRRTGRNAFSDSRRRTTAYRRTAPKIEEGAVRFDQRGAYEEAIYGTRAGSYTYAGRTRRRGGR